MGRTTGYYADLPRKEEGYEPGFIYIAFSGWYRWALVLSQTNKRSAKCLECHSTIVKGDGIYHRMFRHNGYVCLDCAKELIRRNGQELGFSEDLLFNLSQTLYHKGDYTAEQVASSIRRAAVESTPIAIQLPARTQVAAEIGG